VNNSLVIIPTYNEKENIEAIIAKVFSLEKAFDILIVDDNSPDGTGQLVKNLQVKKNPKEQQLNLLVRAGKLGLGTAYIAGFKYAISHQYDYIFEMDADFSHNPKDLLALYEACHNQGQDVAIGSRYANGVVNVVNWPIGRVLMSYFASVYVRLITGMHIMDTTAGFVCYKRKVLETINLDRVRFIGYAFQIEMKFTSFKFGFNIMEVPIIFTDRTKGTSKMSSGIFKEAVIGVLQMKINSWFKKYLRAEAVTEVNSSLQA
jgi:dolichol-phosphate mannosyltransferase